ncbi:hypothetical protein ABZ491_23995 [Micromonospora rifamycinica]|uniref:hypothetical protein n=1 Tax=Micromonospora rifamycinica TaxID=291594 RepID=UPI0033EA8B64
MIIDPFLLRLYAGDTSAGIGQLAMLGASVGYYSPLAAEVVVGDQRRRVAKLKAIHQANVTSAAAGRAGAAATSRPWRRGAPSSTQPSRAAGERSRAENSKVERSVPRAFGGGEALVPLVQPFTSDTPAIAVVGAHGFVGRAVVTRLTEHGHEPLQLGLGDDLNSVRDVDVVISVTGSPGLLGPQHIRPHHRLVVDSGFVPSPDGGVTGDISPEAKGIPQNITPVSGGIGPVEMAVLVERVIRQELHADLAPWQYPGRPYQARTSSPATTARTAALAFPKPTRAPRQAAPQPADQPIHQRGGPARGNSQGHER